MATNCRVCGMGLTSDESDLCTFCWDSEEKLAELLDAETGDE